MQEVRRTQTACCRRADKRKRAMDQRGLARRLDRAFHFRPGGGRALRARPSRLGCHDIGLDRCQQGAQYSVESLRRSGRAGSLGPHLCGASLGVDARSHRASLERLAFHSRIYLRVRARLCELGCRKLRAYRGGHACGSAEVWHQLVFETHERSGLHHRASRGAHHRQFLPALRGMAEGGDPARALHQDRHRDPRRVPRRDRRRASSIWPPRCSYEARRPSSRRI